MIGREVALAAAGLVALFVGLSVVVLSLVWLERKFLGRLQGRIGPMRVGPFGLLQPVADAVKLILKEDVVPAWADKGLFWIAPILMFVPSFMVWVTIPFSRDLVIRNLDMGLFYFIAVSVVSVVGLVMAGWSSASKYAILGGLRSAAQLVSYEIPVIMAVLGVVMLAGSMNLLTVVDKQASVPYILVQPLGLAVFLIAGVAEVGRTPFDIYPAESEIVGGPFVEYSGAHWAIFFLAEYINTFVVALLVTLLFLGGWQWPHLPGVWAPVVVLVKTYLVVMVIFWFRATFPRLRIDQLMAFGWQVLIPLSFVNIVLTGIQLYYRWPSWSLSLMSLGIILAMAYWQYRTQTAPAQALARSYSQRAYSQRRGA
ncbi:MAG: NADH-quinone oxidoreductase subunit NuoH [Chloroflexi bacterium]|nr:NADH-quinone oxidoreductase subunit NuoH [Chloroflexota bacterium]